MYYLIDLERSILWRRLWFWERDNEGYTDDFGIAGLYSESKSAELVNPDITGLTIRVKETEVQNIFKTWNYDYKVFKVTGRLESKD